MQSTSPEIASDPEKAETGDMDRRSYRRVRLPLKARMLAFEKEHTARVHTISVAAVTLVCNVILPEGTPVLIYVEELGRLEGTVTRCNDNAIRIALNNKRSRKTRIADTLIWLINKGTSETSLRRATRIRQDAHAEAILEDGSVLACRILDISVTGASVAIEPRPAVGAMLSIGKMQGRVVRHHETGIGMEFSAAKTKKED